MSYIAETQTILNIDTVQNQIPNLISFIAIKDGPAQAPLLQADANWSTLTTALDIMNTVETVVQESAAKIVEQNFRYNRLDKMFTSFNNSIINADLQATNSFEKGHSITVNRSSDSEMIVMCNFEIVCDNSTGDLNFILGDDTGNFNNPGNGLYINNTGSFSKTVQLTWNTNHLRSYPSDLSIEFALYYGSVDALPLGTMYIQKVTWAVLETIP